MTATATTHTITMEYDLPHAPAKVWRALTDPKLVAQWLMDTDMQLKVGSKFKFTMQPSAWWDGIVRSEMLEVVPNKKLVYSWGSSQGNTELATVVTWTLTPTPSGGTKLSLVHSGFPTKDSPYFAGAQSGWKEKIDSKMRAVLAAL
jgi:uncharacterized protein YndB with AHSA1/START domain